MFEKEFKNEIVEIRGQKVGLGESKLIKIPVDRLPTGTLIEIPVYVFNGKKAGPTVLLQGGLHGDEVNSVELVRRMLIDKSYKIERGCVIVVPLLNVFGFLSLSRDMHGKDVNRSFPGTKAGSLASRMAYYLMHEIIDNVDFGIDFHTGGAQRNNFPQIRFTQEDKQAKFLATLFNAPLMFGSKLIPKSFRNACFKKNIPIIVYEGGESLRLDEKAIQEGINGTLRILKYFKMINASVEISKGKEAIIITKRKWIRAKVAGLFNLKVKNGAKIKKGQILGFIMDTYGETKFAVKAPQDGYIISVNYFPIVNMGDPLFHFGSA
ncbi:MULTISPECIES: succinylglutamate desuccinylase/aspartoacylase family protein [Tenacibaculum]|uniref:succinylglutamate desuccinylase/aspartoacylase family protein n=1 Tax=Tenacibaculum TaxID=104267 RepID=UPI001F0A170E|nr:MULTISPECIES: succinylglutamate desuccinylase/aspartoacylase family protein [Tenacibaculum]MCH3881420.1 succinylglutamate desuccinylase/aspartoacylase family protein [Tenacibaculum aquimarinum]MDO6598986.1 succinylglutamate desuccinylase/aspartoacylase family protein [Tenacibaculum sp. 1_MG-2023]